MNGPLDIVVVNDGGADDAVVRALLSSDPEIRVVDYLDGLGQHVPAADVLIVACGEYNESAATLIREAVEERPTRPVVLVTGGAPNGYVEHAFDAGAADLVVLPERCNVELARAMSNQVRFTLGKAAAQRTAAATRTAERLGRMVVMLGPKGGSGKTLTATNLAAALTSAGNSVAVVDLDLQFGDVGLALGLAPETTVFDLISSGGSLDSEKLDAFLVEHACGARVLLAPLRPDQAGLVTVDFLSEIYRLLRGSHDVVVVDTPPAFTPEVIAAIDASSDVCMIGMLDSLSLKSVRLGLETLELMGYGGGVRFLLNRADSQVGISLDDVTAIVGRPPDVLVPSDRAITRSVNEGVPIALKASRSEAGKAFQRLAGLYAETAPATAKRRRPFRFGRES